MYPRSGTYNTYPQNNVRYGENVAYNRNNYGVTAPTAPYVAGAPINYGENVNYNRTNYGVTAPTAPNIGNTPVYFGEATNRFRPNYGVVPPAAPNVGGASVVFGEATNPNRPNYGITAPVLPAPRTQVNVPPTVQNIPVPQYNVPDRPIYYPTPTTYDAGNYPMPPVNNNPITYAPNTYATVPLQQNLDGTVPTVPVNNNPITYAPNTYPQVDNTTALQALPAGGAEQFNPYAGSIPAEQSIPSTAPRSASYPDMSQAQASMPNAGMPSTSPTREIDGLLGDTNAIIAQGNQVAAFTEQYTAQQEQMRQQQALQRQQQYIPPDLTQQYYQQSQAISNGYQQGQQPQQTQSSSSTNVDGSKLSSDAKKGIAQYGDIIKREAAKNGIPASLLAGLIQQESKFNHTAGSEAGAKGLTQLMPGTAKELGVSDVHNAEQSIAGGAKYLGQMYRKYNGNVTLALAAYNAGPGAVDKAGKNVPPYKETQHYVKVVQANEAKFRSAGFA